jgi:FlaA1/EpsC-like NDP-sugar epimerase
MGEPIRILDIAKSLMAIMGKTESEIAIAFTGVRPGEKMFEELYLTGAELTTRHSDILTVPQKAMAPEHIDFINTEIARMIQMAERGDTHLSTLLQQVANERVDKLFAGTSAH